MQYIRSSKEWFRFFSSEYVWYDYSLEDMVEYHTQLHAQYGDKPDPIILDVERDLSTWLRKQGIEHRYKDELSKKAGTLVENPAPPTVGEIQAYLKNVTLESPAIEVLQDIAGGRIFLGRISPLLKPLQTGVIRALNAALPPGVTLAAPTKRASSKDFVRAISLFDLKLAKQFWAPERVTTWETIALQLNAEAIQVSKIYANRGGANIPFHVVKAGSSSVPEERIVTGIHLEPGVIDKTTLNPDGTPTGADGDTYDDAEVRKAMFWWMENGGQTFTYLHPGQGGFQLGSDAVKLLENWQARTDFVEGEQQITKGAWLSTVRIYNDGLWVDIKAGNLKSFSIDAAAMGSFEQVTVPA